MFSCFSVTHNGSSFPGFYSEIKSAVLEGSDCKKSILEGDRIVYLHTRQEATNQLSSLIYFALLHQAVKDSITDVFNLPASSLSTVLCFTSQVLSVTGCSQSLLIKAMASKNTSECLFPFSIHYDD